MITYRQIDYEKHTDKDEIIRLYKDIFNVDFDIQYDFWFRSDQLGKPVGIVAIDNSCDKTVGHFTTVAFKGIIGGHIQPFRISMGFMTDPDYRGQGIATNLYYEIKKAVLAENEENCFIIGFPNDNSFHMHVDRMEYENYKSMQFVQLPNQDRDSTERQFKRIDTISGIAPDKDIQSFNIMYHDVEFLSFRYSDSKYEKYISGKGNLYICTQFRDKVDILYWSAYFDEKELLEFVQFLYTSKNISKVTTWNSLDYLDKYPKEDREYHMCINYLDNDSNQAMKINSPWIFFMGDCELF